MSFVAIGIGLATSIGGTIFGGIAQKKLRQKMEAKEKEAKARFDAQRDIYQNVDISNPFLNMENTMEDLTINQQQAQFERDTFQQSQANIMQTLQGAAGGSGVAALAQSLAQQGQLASQKASASIGAQEASNIRAKAQMAGQIQGQERAGRQWSSQMEMQKQGTLLGMDQSQMMAYGQQAYGAAQTQNQMLQQGMQQFGGQLTTLGTQAAQVHPTTADGGGGNPVYDLW